MATAPKFEIPESMKQEILKAAESIIKAQTSLYEFFKQAWTIIEPGRPFVDGPHIKAICEHLEAVSNGTIKRLIINIPPRMTKSSLVSIVWPMWDWINYPWRQFLFASHSHALTMEHAFKSRNIVESDWYQRLWGHLFTLEKQTESLLMNSGGGYRKCTSVKSSITGGGADIIVADDLNDTAKVMSDSVRGYTNLWFSSTLCMRLNDRKDGAIVIVMQRSHELDVTGYALLDDEINQWVHLRLPMEFEPKKKCKTVVLKKGEKPWEDWRKEDGELLWPQKVDANLLKAMKSELKGEYQIAGQLQQSPSPPEGGLIKRKYFKWWCKPNPPKLIQVVQSWDTAITEEDRKNNAYSACTTWGIFDDFGEDDENIGGIKNIILLDCWRGKLEYPALRKMIQRLTKDYHDKGEDIREPDARNSVDYVLIEEKSSGAPLIQDLRRGGVLAVAFVPDKFGDKISRVQIASPLMECGKVWLPASPFTRYQSLLPYAEKFLEQCILFPNAESRDYVDTLSQMLLRLMTSGIIKNASDPTRRTKSGSKEKYYAP